MMPVTQEQFEVVSDSEVRHEPTGTVFSCFRFEKPEYAASTIKVQRGPDHKSHANDDYCIHELSVCAVKLLRS